MRPKIETIISLDSVKSQNAMKLAYITKDAGDALFSHFSMDPANKDIIVKNYNELTKQEYETLRLTPKQFLDRLFKGTDNANSEVKKIEKGLNQKLTEIEKEAEEQIIASSGRFDGIGIQIGSP